MKKVKNFKVLIPALLLVIASLSGCTEKTVPVQSGESILIHFNETKNMQIGGSNISLSFTAVEDFRVPLSECEMSYGSRANVTIALSDHVVHLPILGCNTDNQGNILDNTEYVDTLGYHINAYRLEPYPDGSSIDVEDYILKLNISKL